MRRILMWILYALGAIVAVVILFVVYTVIQFARLPDPAAAAAEPTAASEEELDGARNLAEILEPIRREKKLPALAAAVVKDGRTVALGAVGVRRAGGTERVGVNDRFHIGSCTKSMTATLSAILVQQGKLKWGSTIGEVFADQADKILPAYHDVTLEQLLMHRSGIKDGATTSTVWKKIWSLKGPMLEQRREFVELVLAEKPAAARGAKFIYSNYGYTIAGAMCERVTDKTWEDLMREELFTPLGMTTAGFGPPGDANTVDQPFGHHIGVFSSWKPMPPGRQADNPAVIGPAGTVHCSLADWAKYAAFHVRGARGEEQRLPAEVFRKLHTPFPDDAEAYAYGWVVSERDWAGGKALMHAGSNTMWMAVIWLAPARNSAYLAATNVAGATAFPACDAAIGKLIELSSLP
ncbi:MAG: serine hydrolase domain-containing protein [Pirellulales bacterium]